MGKLRPNKKKINKKALLNKKRMSTYSASKERYAKLIEQAAEGIVIFDSRGQIILANAIFCRMAGYTRREILLHNILDTYISKDKKHGLKRLKELAAGHPLKFERSMLRKNGSVFPIEASVVRIASGESLAIIRDITERKHMEDKLKDSEYQYHVLFDFVPMPITITTIDNKIILVNKAAEKLMGFTLEEYGRTRKITGVYKDPSQRDRLVAILQKEGKVRDFEVQYLRKDGVVISALLNADWIEYGGKRYILTTVLDITEKKKSEEELKESEERLRTIFENNTDAILMVELETRKYTFSNKKTFQMIGYSSEEIKGMSIESFHRKEDLPYVLDQFEKIAGGAITLARDIPVRRKDGSVFYADVNGFPVTFSGKKYVVGFFRDVTERKNAQEKLKQSEERFIKAFQASPVLMSITTMDEGRFIEVNDYFLRTFDYKREDVIGKTVLDLNIYADPEQRNSFIQLLKTQGFVREFETQVRGRNGEIRNGLLSVEMIELQGKKYLLTVVSDITEHKKLKDQFKQSEDRYRNLFDWSPDGIIITKLDGSVFAHNRAVELASGYSSEDFEKVNVQEIYVDTIRRNQMLSLLKTNGRVRDFELALRRKDGSIFYTLMNVDWVELEGQKFLFSTLRDITELRRAQMVLEENEKRYHEFFATSRDCVFITSASGKWIDFNDVAVEMFGHESRQALSKVSISSLYANEQDRVAFLALIDKQGYIKEHPARLKRKDGTAIDVLITSGVRVNKDTSEKEYFGTIRDVTEKKRMEDSLRFNEERYRLLAENASDVIWTMDLNGQFTYFSPSVLQQRGYTSEEATALTIGQTLTPASLFTALKVFNEAVARVKAGQKQESVQMELEHYRKDGSIIWCDVTSSILCDASKNAIGFMGITRDVTERKRAEAALKESEQRYRLLADNISDVIFVLDMNMHFTYFSPSVKQKFGFTPEEMMLKRVDEALAPDSFRLIISAIAEELEEERSGNVDLARTRTLEVQEYHKDGSLIDVEIIASFLRDDQKHPVGILGVTRDITERKRIEKELRESHQNLEVKVKERTVELEAANQKLSETAEELKRAMKVKSDFLANMSHELRTPLNSINGFSEVLVDETFGTLNIKQKEYLKYILISGKHLLSLINDVLDMAKMEAGKEKLSISVVFMKDLLEESVALVQEMALKKKIVTCLDLPQDIGYIDADERKIKEVVYNLFSNAIKFTPEGGRIEVRAVRTASEVEVAIQDSGVGISKEDAARIFEAFTRLENPFTRLTEGTGLGLAYSRKLVELHGGRVWVESEGIGKGSTFKFTVPIKAK